MGFLSRLFPSNEAANFAMGGQTPLRSPWSSTMLTRVVLSDLTGLVAGDVSRAQAMKIPAVAKGRALIAGTLSRYPLGLFDYNADTRLSAAPWMVSTQSGQSPTTRMLWTLDDLIFSGVSVWAVERDADDQVIDAIRVNPALWTLDPNTGTVLIQDQPVRPDQVIIFEGPQEGLVTIASDAIVASRNMSNAWQQRVNSPIPLIELHEVDENGELTDDEVDEAIAAYEAARKSGGTAFTPKGLELKVHGNVPTDLFIEGRNAERLDWANYMNIPASLLEGSMSTASLTYSTEQGKRNELVDYSLNYWASAIESRLSQDDVTPQGTYVRFDLEWLTSPEQVGTNPPGED